jgi:hypothetical protein
MDGRNTDSGYHVGFSGARATDKDEVMRLFHKGPGRQLPNLCLLQVRPCPVEAQQVAVDGKLGRLDLIRQAAGLRHHQKKANGRSPGRYESSTCKVCDTPSGEHLMNNQKTIYSPEKSGNLIKSDTYREQAVRKITLLT